MSADEPFDLSQSPIPPHRVEVGLTHDGEALGISLTLSRIVSNQGFMMFVRSLGAIVKSGEGADAVLLILERIGAPKDIAFGVLDGWPTEDRRHLGHVEIDGKGVPLWLEEALWLYHHVHGSLEVTNWPAFLTLTSDAGVAALRAAKAEAASGSDGAQAEG